MAVVSLAAAREERTPHWQGQAICLGCRHIWEASAPVGVNDSLECPACNLTKGAVRNLWAAPDGALELQCNCGSHVLTAYKRASDGLMVVRCIGCGTDLTHAFYEG